MAVRGSTLTMLSFPGASTDSPSHFLMECPLVNAVHEGINHVSSTRVPSSPPLSGPSHLQYQQESIYADPLSCLPPCRAWNQSSPIPPSPSSCTQTSSPTLRHVSIECDVCTSAKHALWFRELVLMEWRVEGRVRHLVSRCLLVKPCYEYWMDREHVGSRLSWDH